MHFAAKKEDDPEGALQDFNAVVEAEAEKGKGEGDWFVFLSPSGLELLCELKFFAGALRL